MAFPKAGVVIMAVFQVLICMSIWIPLVKSDPDPLFDFAPGVTDFVLRDVFKNGVVSEGPGGIRAALNVTVFPALQSQGITYVHFRMLPCGINLPHSHPRATEILTMVSGGPLQAGLVDTSGKPHIYVLYPGDLILFPRGLLHYELNIGKEKAFYISALNSENPGVLTSAGVTLMIPDRAAASAFNTDLNTIKHLKNEIYTYADRLQLDKRSGCVPGKDITNTF